MLPIVATALGLIDTTDEWLPALPFEFAPRTLASLWDSAAPWSSFSAFSSSCDRSLGCLVPLLPLLFGVYDLGA
jgi:hypothetical protein